LDLQFVHRTLPVWTLQGRGGLGPIILSPLNGPVKMSPYETGDISLQSERVATSGRDFIVGGEIRRPLGVAIVGGLILSQILTLFAFRLSTSIGTDFSLI
jgi:hypothetical protein